MYDEYLQQYLKHEALTDALQRAIEYSIKWGEEKNCPPHDFLRYGNPNAVAFAISTGRISPWIVFNCSKDDIIKAILVSEYEQIGLKDKRIGYIA